MVIYRGEFDEEMNRDGYRIEWDTDNGKERVGGVDLYEGWYLTGMKENMRIIIQYTGISNGIEITLSLLYA